MSYKDPVAATAQKYKPIQSAVPGTTLGPIQIDAFMGGGVCNFHESIFSVASLVVVELITPQKPSATIYGIVGGSPFVIQGFQAEQRITY